MLPAFMTTSRPAPGARGGPGLRWRIGLVLAPALYVVPQLVTPLPDVTPTGMRTLGTFLAVVACWICETLPIPVAALAGMALLVTGGIMPVERAFGFWANWVNVFLIGAFVIGHAAALHGVNRRFAYKMLSLPIVSRRPWALLATFWLATALLSTISSNVVCTIVFLSIGVGLLDTLDVPRDHPVGGVLVLGVGWAAGIGGIGTPVGTPPNMIAIGLLDRLGYRVGFLGWSIVGLVTMFVLLLALYVTMRWIVRPDVSVLAVHGDAMRRQLDALGPVTRAEWLSMAAMALALVVWLLPDLASMILGERHDATVWLQTKFGWPVSAILLASLLFAVPVGDGNRFLMRWDEAVRGIEWGTLALIAGALALGDAIASPTVGIGRFLSHQVSTALDPSAPWYVLVGACVGLTTLVTNVMSNNATVGLVLPIALQVANAPGAAVDPRALGVVIGIASSLAFALPAATPPVAIVYASGRIRIADMIRYGAAMAALGWIAVTLVAYVLAAAVL